MIRRHCATLQAEAAHIADAVAQVVAGQGGTDAAVTAFKAAHTLKGSSGTLGFAEVSAAALRLETALRPLRERPAEAGELPAIVAAQEALAVLAADIAPEQSSLYRRMTG